ncbi:pyridoxal phosphate-dependent aminotransferase [Pseudooceanicola spongiae]|uniref:Aminotransferase n=1 Tax=Pseudooceanicola spongiae TaxID=2613965 RepID=A0A7L9WIY8_9RHOB|nr:aminotransferase class I/II-fold pyridoxal phosphate-dependent enzyme [Pseudooceanicola spongiae]QOL80361.1 aminotransferase class I/II-fold pyridoxal phosphate-dependent enzyme [Pseudooceanicola spongiae]
MRVSSRGDVDPFIVMDVMTRARELEAEGRRIIHMEVGQPGTPAPKGAREALKSALESEALGYSVTLGLPALRARIAALYGEWYDLDLNPDRVVVTTGSSAGFLLSFASLFDAGARVGIGAPGYPSYRQLLKAMDLEPVILQTTPEARYQPRPDDLRGQGLQGLMIASPGNPSGTMLSRTALSDLMGAAADEGISLISDEIYHGLHYEDRAVSALEISDETYVINSFSKYFSMTGWRVGWMVVPEAHVRRVERLAQHMFICAPTASQVAALGALDCHEELQANVAVYARNRQLLLEHLPQAGFTRIAPPDGGFYVYADVRDLTQDSRVFAREILEQAGVAVTPGLDFDATRGAGTLRFSYAGATEDLEEAMQRLKTFMAKRPVVV